MNSRTIGNRLNAYASPHKPAPQHAAGRRAVTALSRLAGAGLLAWIGYIHLHLWQEGYRSIPTDGPLFLLDAIAAFAFAALLVLRPRPLAGLLSAGFTLSTIGALLVSLSIGLFGFHESIAASFVVQSLAIESLAVIILATWTVLASAPPTDPPGPAAGPITTTAETGSMRRP